MKRLLVALALLAVALLAWDRALQRREDGARAAGLRIGPLLTDAERAGRAVAAMRVDTGAGESWLFAQAGGMWRCVSCKGAVADAAALEEIVQAVLQARGMPVSADAAHPESYGLGGPDALTLTLYGPGFDAHDAVADALIALDLGRASASGPIASEGGSSHAGSVAALAAGRALAAGSDSHAFSFVRRHGSREIWTAELDLSALLGRGAQPGEPPLLERALVPAGWPAQSPRVRRLRVEREGQPPFDLVLRARTLSAEQVVAGLAPWQWQLRVDGRDGPCAEGIVQHFDAFALLAPWQAIVDPTLYPTLGFDKPRARLFLEPPEGDPLVLQLGGHAPDGRPVVLDSVTGLIHEIEPAQEALLFPEAAAFASGATNDPWERLVEAPRPGDGPR